MRKPLSIIFSISLFIVLLSCRESTNDKCDCDKFKNGDFIYKSGGIKYIIKRRDTIQIETDPKTGFYSKLSIKWTDKCNYEGLCIESTFPFSDSIQKVRKTIPIKVQIIATGDNYYVFKAHRENSPYMTDTIWVDQK